MDELTAREQEVVKHLIVDGATNREIAATMHLSTKTVKQHMGSAQRKLRAKNRTHLAVLVLAGGGA